MINPVAVAHDNIDPTFQQIEQKINSQLKDLLDICAEHNDTHWLLSEFQRILNEIPNNNFASSLDGIVFYAEPDITYDSKYGIEGPCWFDLTTSTPKAYDAYEHLADAMEEAMGNTCDNGNLQIAETDKSGLPIRLYVPDGGASYVYVRGLLSYCYDDPSIISDDEILDALHDFADFIEVTCQDVIDEVAIAVRRRYRKFNYGRGNTNG